MGLRGYTLSETQAPYPLCLDLCVCVWGGAQCCRKHMMDGHYVLCPKVINSVNSQPGKGGGGVSSGSA